MRLIDGVVARYLDQCQQARLSGDELVVLQRFRRKFLRVDYAFRVEDVVCHAIEALVRKDHQHIAAVTRLNHVDRLFKHRGARQAVGGNFELRHRRLHVAVVFDPLWRSCCADPRAERRGQQIAAQVCFGGRDVQPDRVTHATVNQPEAIDVAGNGRDRRLNGAIDRCVAP